MEYFSCYDPGSKAEKEVDVIDVGGYSSCGNCHECIIQGDAKDSLGVDTLSWLAEDVGKGAWHSSMPYYSLRVFLC